MLRVVFASLIVSLVLALTALAGCSSTVVDEEGGSTSASSGPATLPESCTPLPKAGTACSLEGQVCAMCCVRRTCKGGVWRETSLPCNCI